MTKLSARLNFDCNKDNYCLQLCRVSVSKPVECFWQELLLLPIVELQAQ